MPCFWLCNKQIDINWPSSLQAGSINCGSVPTNGVLVTSALTKHDISTPAALYVPSYTKANGCPANATASGLSCTNCMFGASSGNQGRIFNCAVNTQVRWLSVIIMYSIHINRQEQISGRKEHLEITSN